MDHDECIFLIFPAADGGTPRETGWSSPSSGEGGMVFLTYEGRVEPFV